MVEKVEAEVYRGGDHQETVTEQVDPDSEVKVEITEVDPDEFECTVDGCDRTFDSKRGRSSHESQSH